MSVTGFSNSDYLSFAGAPSATALMIVASLYLTTGDDQGNLVEIFESTPEWRGLSRFAGTTYCSAWDGSDGDCQYGSTPYDQWVQLAAAFRSTTFRDLWLDGSSVASTTDSFTPNAPTTTHVGQNNGADFAFEGLLAEVQIWDLTGLSSGEVDALIGLLVENDPRALNAVSGGTYEGLLWAYWRLGDITDLADYSGNGRNLTMTGTLTNAGVHPTTLAPTLHNHG